MRQVTTTDICIMNWSDLESPECGIDPLTGEACALGRRILCDLNEKGVEHVRTFLGLPENTRFESPWNGTSGIGRHVASVMLPKSCFMDLAIHIAQRRGFEEYVLDVDHGILYATMKPKSDTWQRLVTATRESNEGRIIHRNFPQTSGNTHMMSGRQQG